MDKPPKKKKADAGRIICIVPHEKVPDNPPQADDTPANDLLPEDTPVNVLPLEDPDEPSRYSLDSCTSSAPALPSPIQPLHQEGVAKVRSHVTDLHKSFDTLSLEIEVQDLVDRVTALESGQSSILHVQNSILQKQEVIFSQLSAIENDLYSQPNQRNYHQNHHFATYTPQPPKNAPPMNNSVHWSHFSFNKSGVFPPSNPPLHIPPPPRHSPSHVTNRADETRREIHKVEERSRQVHRADENFHGVYTTGRASVTKSQIPFQQVQPHNSSPGYTVHQQRKKNIGALPSSVIYKDRLIPVCQVFQNYPKLLCTSKVGSLAVKLARESYFGEDVMVQCTVAGERDLPGLPVDELQQLKQALYMRFHQHGQSPQEFEQLWKTATEAIGQACKRLRSKQ